MTWDVQRTRTWLVDRRFCLGLIRDHSRVASTVREVVLDLVWVTFLSRSCLMGFEGVSVCHSDSSRVIWSFFVWWAKSLTVTFVGISLLTSFRLWDLRFFLLSTASLPIADYRKLLNWIDFHWSPQRRLKCWIRWLILIHWKYLPLPTWKDWGLRNTGVTLSYSSCIR